MKANTTSLPACTNSRCMALTRSGCSKTTSGALLPRWRYPRLSNSHIYPSATKIASPDFKRSKNPEYWIHYNKFLLISNLFAISFVYWLDKADSITDSLRFDVRYVRTLSERKLISQGFRKYSKWRASLALSIKVYLK